MPIVHFKKLSFSTCAQTLGQRSPWGLNFERCRLIFLGPQYGTCFTNILVAQNFERATRILGYLCAPLTKCALRNTVRVYLSLLCFIVCTVFFVLFVQFCIDCTVFCIVYTVFLWFVLYFVLFVLFCIVYTVFLDCLCCFVLFVLFILCFVLFRLCIFILICFVCTSVRTTATE